MQCQHSTHRLAVFKAEAAHVLQCLVGVAPVQARTVLPGHSQALSSTGSVNQVVVLVVAAIYTRNTW